MRELSPDQLTEVLTALGEQLEAAGESAGLLVVGGAALGLLGWVRRTTGDVDVIAQFDPTDRSELREVDEFPEALRRAASTVARDFGLPRDWLNPEIAAQWKQGLPDSILEGVEWRIYGALVVGLVGRQTLISLKLYAAVDQGPESVHYQDLVELSPSDGELNRARSWVLGQDTGPDFPDLVRQVIERVRAETGTDT